MTFYLNDYMYDLFVIVPIFLLIFIVNARVNMIYNKYSKERNSRGMTGAEAARRILDMEGLKSVRIEKIHGHLTDHFDPRANVLRLSAKNYDEDSVAAVGVAAHEAGHAIQHARKYVPVKLRAAMVPAIKMSNWIYPLLIVVGFCANLPIMFHIVIGFFLLTTIFQFVTLPVEFNASLRAISIIKSGGILNSQEIGGAKKVLWAASMTYVVALLLSLAQLLRLFLNSRNSDD